MSQATRQSQQINNIVMITGWSGFASYALNTILILFLVRSTSRHGLGYDQSTAYAFIGISAATGYLMPILGGYMADNIIGMRRSILFGSILCASAYLLVMLSGYTIPAYGDYLFIAAYALFPAASSLLIGTASAMVSLVYTEDATKAKSAMTYYYMSINVGALLACWIAPELFDSRYGPLSVLALAFAGKAIAALNFIKNYSLYDNITSELDKIPLSNRSKYILVIYLLAIYLFTLFAYSHILFSSILISLGCILGIVWFWCKTLLLSGPTGYKQGLACLLIVESIVFFIIYNQMSTTLVLFAASNSNANLFGLTISPAQYQLLNPLLIIAIGLQLPRFYRKFPRFSIPYQFACGTLLAGFALIILAVAAAYSDNGLINGNYIATSYIFISLAELWVSAIGLSMIGLYCDQKSLSFSMGVWYLGCSLASIFSGHIAHWVAINDNTITAVQRLMIYQKYYQNTGYVACSLGGLMLLIAYYLSRARRSGWSVE